MVVPGRPYILLLFIIIFFHRKISEVRGPISAKFCHMVGSMFNLQMLVQKFGGLPPPKKKNFGCKKQGNFGSISDTFPLGARISLEQIDISKIGKLFDRQHFLPRWSKKVR